MVAGPIDFVITAMLAHALFSRKTSDGTDDPRVPPIMRTTIKLIYFAISAILVICFFVIPLFDHIPSLLGYIGIPVVTTAICYYYQNRPQDTNNTPSNVEDTFQYPYSYDADIDDTDALNRLEGLYDVGRRNM